MTTASSRALRRCAAVLLLAILGGWLVTGVGIHRADGAEKLRHAEAFVPNPPPPPPPPTLTLTPKEGEPNTRFRVDGSGFSSCGDELGTYVELIWDANERLDPDPPSQTDSDGRFSVYVNVPPTATPGDHQVVGKTRCGSESGAEIFTVPPPPPPPTLTLNSQEGLPGKIFNVQGSGYRQCAHSEFPQVEVLWDANERLATAPMGADGQFSADVQVPPTAAPGNHKVVGKCGAESPEADFTVLPPSSPTLTLTPKKGPSRRTRSSRG